MKEQGLARETRLKLSYLYGGTVVYEAGEVLGPRLLSDFEAVLIIEGFPAYETAEGVQKLGPGSILIAQPGSHEIYYWDKKNRTRHAYLHFDLDAIPSDWPALSDWPRFNTKPAPMLAQLFRYITGQAMQYQNWPAQQPGDSDTRIFETFLDLFLTADLEMDPLSRSILSEPVRRAVKFMRTRLDNPYFAAFTLDELANAANVSAKHLCRAFRKDLGISPMKACRLVQFQLAISLLARSNHNIREISERCGFPDQLYFSRTFSQAFGQSPSRLRTSIRQGNLPPRIPLPPALTPRLHW